MTEKFTRCGYSNCFRPFFKKRGFMPCCEYHYKYPKKWPIDKDGNLIFTGSVFRQIVPSIDEKRKDAKA